jgi:hypothetical protein
MVQDTNLPLNSLRSDWAATNPIDGRFLDDRWRGAVQVLTQELPSSVIKELFERMEKDPDRWYTPLHLSFGMGVRNLMRSKGFTDAVFGCNLDDVCAPIIRDAVRQMILGPIAANNNVCWQVTWENGLAKVQFSITDAHGLVKTEKDVPILLSAYLNRNALDFSSQIGALEDMISSSNTTERDLQKFFEEYPRFLLGLEYVRLYPQVILELEEGGLIPDFFLEPVAANFCDIIDLKRPSEPVIVGRKNRRRFGGAILEGVAQLREYGQFFDDPRNRQKILRTQGITAYRPKLTLLIGRTPFQEDQLMLRRIKEDSAVSVMTYDDLLGIAKNQLRNLVGAG